MMAMMTLIPRSLPDDPLAIADQDVANAEERRDRQVRIISDLAEGTEARACAERILQIVEGNLALMRVHQSVIQQLIEDDLLD